MAKVQAPLTTRSIGEIVEPYIAEGSKKKFTKKKVDEVLALVRADGVTRPDELIEMFRAVKQLSVSRDARGLRDAFDSDKTQNYFTDQIVREFDTPQKFMALPEEAQFELGRLMRGFENGRPGETRGHIRQFSGPNAMRTESATRDGLQRSGVPQPIINRMIDEQKSAVWANGKGAALEKSGISKVLRGDVDYVYVFSTWVTRPGKEKSHLTQVFYNPAGQKIGVVTND